MAAVTAEGGQGPWKACFRVSKGQVGLRAGGLAGCQCRWLKRGAMRWQASGVPRN